MKHNRKVFHNSVRFNIQIYNSCHKIDALEFENRTFENLSRMPVFNVRNGSLFCRIEKSHNWKSWQSENILV